MDFLKITNINLFYITEIVTLIILLLFFMANYKYTNFLLTKVNIMYILSLILGLSVILYLGFNIKNDNTKQSANPDANSDAKSSDGVEEYIPMYLKNIISKVKQNLLNSVPVAKQSATNLLHDLNDNILIKKYVSIYKLVFEILTIDAIIANNRTAALNKTTNSSDPNATIDVLRSKMMTISSIKKSFSNNKEILIKLTKLNELIDKIKVALDKNIIVALQLIYDVDTQDSPFSTQILNRAESEAIQHISKLSISSLKPDDDNKYFDKDIYTQDYEFLGSKINELDNALIRLLGKQTQHEYELIADSIQTSRYIFGVSGAVAGKENFKDLVEVVFKNDNTGGIYRFMDRLFDIIQKIKSA